jgi:ABC-type proline/glycine betaine transport system permease subunit
VKKLVKQYASTLLEGLVIAVAFALVDGLRSHVMTSVIAGAAGLVVGVFLGIGIAEHTEKQDTQV